MNIIEEGRKKVQRIFFVLRHEVKGFTIMELVVATVIVGVLVTLGFAQYSSYKERTYDSEAKANLRLIAAAEGIYRMEGNNNWYLDSTWGTAGAGQPQETVHINEQLRLLLNSDLTTRVWDYKTTVNNTVSPRKFCVQSDRFNGPNARQFKFLRTGNPATSDPEPVANQPCPPLP